MQGRSAQFDTTISKPHTAVAAVNVIQDGKVVQQLAVHSGSVPADRMAAQMRSMECQVSDPTGTLTPVDMNSLLAPFGTRIQMFRGVQNSSVSVQSAVYGTASSWVPSGRSTGVFVSTKVDADGFLTLGP